MSARVVTVSVDRVVTVSVDRVFTVSVDRVFTVSVGEYLVILHLQVKASHCVSVWDRDIRKLKRKLAGNFLIRLTFDAQQNKRWSSVKRGMISKFG